MQSATPSHCHELGMQMFSIEHKNPSRHSEINNNQYITNEPLLLFELCQFTLSLRTNVMQYFAQDELNENLLNSIYM